MISIDCSEMTLDDQLALASSISEGLSGKAVALVKDDKIVLDALSRVGVTEVVAIIRSFVSGRDDPKHYSVDADGESIVVHTPDPLGRSRGRKDTGQLLPDNLQKCPYSSCGFVTPYAEIMKTHILMHGL